MAEYRMRVVEAPPGTAARAWQYYPSRDTQGPPEDVYLCGTCGIILARNLAVRLAPGARLQCSNCGAWNAPAPSFEPNSAEDERYGPSGVNLVGKAPGISSSGESVRTVGPVVVIDDEPEILHVVCETLELEGLETICLDQPAAVHTLEPRPAPRLFLVDIMLPNTNGIDLARELWNRGYAETPMVAMSASPSMLQAATASDLFRETVAKPFDLTQLVDTVEKYLVLTA